MTRALIVHIELRTGARERAASPSLRSPSARLEEAMGLAQAIDLDIVGSDVVTLSARNPATLIGAGKVAELGAKVLSSEAELVVVNAHVSPGQQRNLEKAWKAKVLDRSGLILEIFGRRARTKEGALQVEHAHLAYQRTRLVRSWTHLERQRGGFGFLGGPGETQIEADRRLIQERMARIEKELEQVKRTRGLHRRSRAKVPYPTVALVGYTNAGKSTLFNALTGAGVLAKDLLFATLDPAMREVALPHGGKVILSDTVGFISELPTTLVAAFRATLEEVVEATLILHVRDIAHAESDAQASDVDQVLKELGLDEHRRAGVIEVWNKADLLPPEERERIEVAADRKPGTALVSSVTGQGLDRLLALVEERLAATRAVFALDLGPEEGAELAWLYEAAEVLDREDDEEAGSISIVVRIDPSKVGAARSRFGARLRQQPPASLHKAAE